MGIYTGTPGGDVFPGSGAADTMIGLGGNDAYDFSNYASGFSSTIDLRPGEWTRTGATQTANLGGGHIARGNTAGELRYEVQGGNAHVFADLDGNGRRRHGDHRQRHHHAQQLGFLLLTLANASYLFVGGICDVTLYDGTGGDGAGAAILFAALGGLPTPSAGDYTVDRAFAAPLAARPE